MKKLRYVLASLLMLGLAISAVTVADDDGDINGKRCSNIGTWFGVVSPEDSTLTGTIWTAMGKSENYGTNLLEQPDFPPTLFGAFPDAVASSMLRGNWDRTGNRTFVYTAMGYGVRADYEIEYVAKIKGEVSMTPDCQFAFVTGTLEVYLPFMDPFEVSPFPVSVLPSQWGRRAYVDLP